MRAGSAGAASGGTMWLGQGSAATTLGAQVCLWQCLAQRCWGIHCGEAPGWSSFVSAGPV